MQVRLLFSEKNENGEPRQALKMKYFLEEERESAVKEYCLLENKFKSGDYSLIITDDGRLEVV